jgi:drug/metabolite transporter (DMT)-like permease
MIFGVHILLYFYALKHTSVTVVFLLGALNPAVVGLFGWMFLNEHPSRPQALWTAVAIGAAIAVVVERGPAGESQLFGNVIALLSALAYCGYFLVSRDARRSHGTTEFLTVTTLVSMLIAGGSALVGGVPLRIGVTADLWLMALIGLVPGTIGHLTVSWALRHVEVHTASTVLLAVPLFASLWAYALVGERVALGQILAGTIVLLALPGAVRRPTAPPVYEELPAPRTAPR